MQKLQEPEPSHAILKNPESSKLPASVDVKKKKKIPADPLLGSSISDDCITPPCAEFHFLLLPPPSPSPFSSHLPL